MHVLPHLTGEFGPSHLDYSTFQGGPNHPNVTLGTEYLAHMQLSLILLLIKAVFKAVKTHASVCP